MIISYPLFIRMVNLPHQPTVSGTWHTTRQKTEECASHGH